MNDVGIRSTIILNRIANSIGGFLLSPIEFLPDAAAACAVAIVTGVLMLIGFKYTSHQTAIKRIRDGIKAELLALSLFKDRIAVSLLCQARIILNSFKSVLYTLVPIGAMIVPVSLLLGQLSLWWQASPLKVGDEAVITVKLAGDSKNPMPEVQLKPSSAIETTTGPIRIRTQRAICWNVKAKEAGYHQIAFTVDDKPVEKQLAVGRGAMRVSVRRPEWRWSDVLLYPAEDPFDPQSPVKSIEIQYPERHSWMSGTHSWLIFWFAASTVAALCLRGVFHVNL